VEIIVDGARKKMDDVENQLGDECNHGPAQQHTRPIGTEMINRGRFMSLLILLL
jgi:hypothetical protein